MKYKIGQKVRVKSLDWYHHNKDGFGSVCVGDKKPKFTYAMSKYCGQVLTVDGHFEYEGEYYMIEDDGVFTWTDEMFEGVVEDGVNGEYYLTPIYFVRPNGYQFVDENGNIINATKIVLEKKKKEYPKTYEECCRVLEIRSLGNGTDGYKWEIISTFQNLIICRDAYWKIAGEEMGLDGPWEPDWTNIESPKYCITYVESKIKIAKRYIINTILAFPTEEMRDAFYENFKELIVQCKELL